VDVTFETAVDAIVNGDLPLITDLVSGEPGLPRARSQRPHRATLLHYLAANGVEDERQKSPPNAPQIARVLLAAGAVPDALAEMYGGQHTTMTMLVSSVHPAKAGVEDALVEELLDHGAAIEGVGSGTWGAPLMTALAFGHSSAAEILAHRGAKTDRLAAAAGLGRLPEATHLLPKASPIERHCALALAAQHGQVEIVRLLLDAGEDPNRYNPVGFHGHSTPLHQAVWEGHEEVVRLLINRKARTDIKDTVFHGTALGWAKHAGRTNLEKYLA
jgi:ankyrin repeat protein